MLIIRRSPASLIVSIVFALMWVCSIPPALCAENCTLELAGFALEGHGSRLIVHAPLRLNDNADVVEQLRGGAELRLTADIEIRENTLWPFNTQLATTNAAFYVRYDPLIRAFFLTSGENRRQFSTLDRLLHDAWDSTPLRIQLDQPLIRGEQYTINIRFTLQHTDVPSWLKKLLFFKSWKIAPPLSFTQSISF